MPKRRTTSTIRGNSRYSCVSTAIDQNAPFGLGEPTTSCSSEPNTTTDRNVGLASPGWGTIAHATSRLKISAGQYGGRMRQMRRWAKRPRLPTCHPRRAGATASEKPDSTMKIATAKWPYTSRPVHHGPLFAGKPVIAHQPAVVQDDEQRGDAAHALESRPGAPSPGADRRRGHVHVDDGVHGASWRPACCPDCSAADTDQTSRPPHVRREDRPDMLSDRAADPAPIWRVRCARPAQPKFREARRRFDPRVGVFPAGGPRDTCRRVAHVIRVGG